MTALVETDTIRCAALFVSVQHGAPMTGDEAIHRAIDEAIDEFGAQGCTARVAEEFGDHPDTAVARMRWVHAVMDRAPTRAHHEL